METHRWGDYEISEVLGKGGMGIVYKGRQISLDRPVAIKVLPSSLTEKKDFVERFYREAKSVAKINCPQIIQVYGAGEFEGKHYFAMEFVEGDDIAVRLKKGEQFDLSKILFISGEVAKALAAAGEKNIIHRDIKPANIMLTNKAEVKVMDFGLAKLTDEGSELTQTGVVMGTVNYLSPEQGQGKDCDQRSDIYSLGVVMYELLSGTVPFKGDNPSAVIYQHIHTKPPSLTIVNPNISKEVEAIVMKCLQKNPNMRYFSARELARDIQALESGKPPKTALMSLSDLKRKKGMAVFFRIFLICAILGGLGAGGWILYQNYGDQILKKFGLVKEDEPEKIDPEKQKREEHIAKVKKLELALNALNEESKTNDLAELQKIRGKLTSLQTEFPPEQFPEAERITVVAETVDSKITKLTKRRDDMARIEKLLGENSFDEAESIARALHNEYPEDLVIENLYKKIIAEKEKFEQEKNKARRLAEMLTNAKNLFDIGSFELAMKKYDEVLLESPTNEEAINGKKQCLEKIQAAKEKEKEDNKEDRGLTAEETLALQELQNHYSNAEEKFFEEDYVGAMLYCDKGLKVSNVEHLPAATNIKVKIQNLKSKVEKILFEQEQERKRKELVANLKQDVKVKSSEGDELKAIGSLQKLVEVDPELKAQYERKIEELYTVHDKKVSSERVQEFQKGISSGDVAAALDLIDPSSPAFYTKQKNDFTDFFKTFTDITSSFDIDGIELSDNRTKCRITGVWDLSFVLKEENIKTAVSYNAELFLEKKQEKWVLTGSKTTRILE